MIGMDTVTICKPIRGTVKASGKSIHHWRDEVASNAGQTRIGDIVLPKAYVSAHTSPLPTYIADKANTTLVSSKSPVFLVQTNIPAVRRAKNTPQTAA